jgi:hypothetical protein
MLLTPGHALEDGDVSLEATHQWCGWASPDRVDQRGHDMHPKDHAYAAHNLQGTRQTGCQGPRQTGCQGLDRLDVRARQMMSKSRQMEATERDRWKSRNATDGCQGALCGLSD